MKKEHKQVDTMDWVSKQLRKAIEVAKKSGINVNEDDFLSVTPLPNEMIAILGAEDEDGSRTTKISIVQGFVLPYEDVDLDIYEPHEEESE
ncbi:hypothetical protein [Lacticaseibacillus paracasei]|uniref:Uncharacterized protein n=1 Tax=Lacticaseibacillus paracasei TaxID=1597 RepID=A0A422M4N5_LACPA|nr:hypothetical protein [Lacticaseibacillus paracasei]RND81505.1 hypothetical protein FAM18157_01429 [Lacticaseibacillus paracasei]RNE19118.1 hypothetical protein FAM3257_02187 [Lacticaseibacillus paracasei]TLQ35191.1 hypothetical protein FEZ40_11390 [Lacticaseibacillus paracasei]